MIIPGFSAYDITEDGVVTHVASGKIIQHYVNTSNGFYKYAKVGIRGDDGKQHTCNVLRLLAITFLEVPEVPCVVRAKDGDNLNTTLQNVEWASYSAGPTNAWKNGSYSNRKPKKRKCCTKESIAYVLNTLEQLTYPVTTAEISRMLDIPYSTARYTIMALVESGKVKYIDRKGFIIT